MTPTTKSPRKAGSKPSPVQPVSKSSKDLDTELFATSLPGFPGQAKIVVLIRSSQKQSGISLAILRVAVAALFSKFKIN
jgi:hypothetical protein